MRGRVGHLFLCAAIKGACDVSDRSGLNKQLFWLYEGHGRGPYVFRLALLIFDVVTIGYFLWATFTESHTLSIMASVIIGIVIALDLIARFYIARSKSRFVSELVNWADLIVVATLLAPVWIGNLVFLRVLRAVRIVRAVKVLRRMRGLSGYLKAHELIVDRTTNLLVFVFIMAAFVYVLQVEANDGISNYIDALYFTVTSLTTTGYGDILMEGNWGRLLAVTIMLLGLTLFLRLVRAIVRPTEKVDFECANCGLLRHDADAVHCKHCGETVHIETRGIE